MTDCDQIDPLVTPYVDGDITSANAVVVNRHILRCRVCSGRVQAERAVQALMRERRPILVDASVPTALRSRCAALAWSQGSPVVPPWRRHLKSLAIAAGLVLAAGAAGLYGLTVHSTRVMAAELTADHVKCFRVVNTVLGTHHDASTVEGAMASYFAWQMRLPDHPERADLELVGARPCLYPEGLAAHIMYRHHGHPVSVFMLPQGARGDALIDVMGHRAAIWSAGDRTFVLIADEPRAEVERITAFLHAGLH
jgi:anti-sigma factor RsiW